MSSIVSRLGDIVYSKYVLPQLPNYMGLTFEIICTQYLVKGYKNRYYYLFSKSGFTDELIKKSKELNVILVDLDLIYN